MPVSSPGWRRMRNSCWHAMLRRWQRRWCAAVAAGCVAWVGAKGQVVLARGAAARAEGAGRSSGHRAASVARGETEQGERMLLKSGHAFGHAVESAQGFGGLLHGEAVAV